MIRLESVIVLGTIAALTLLTGTAHAMAETPEEIESIESLQNWVHEQGYNYTVGENWITELPPGDQDSLCGYRPPERPEEPLPENLTLISEREEVSPTAESDTPLEVPSRYDAMALGYVTPVRDQGGCGSCWIFAATADLESTLAIRESNLPDISEQELGDCSIWRTDAGYNWCNGGDELMTTNHFTIYGASEESCHPYRGTPGSCSDCPILKNVNNWRMITGANGESQIEVIKRAILDYGPVYSTIYANNVFYAYKSGVYEDWSPENPNHAIQIIGWDDTLSHSHGRGAWLIKNSWGREWGSSGPYPGCAWVAYGSANLGDYTNAIVSYSEPGETIFHHDEYGWREWGITKSSGAVSFTPTKNLTLTAIDFWTESNCNYEISIFDKINDEGNGTYTFTSQLGTSINGTANESGYYSIPLGTPIPLRAGDKFIVQINFSCEYIPIEYWRSSWLPDWETHAEFSNKSYYSSDGRNFYSAKPYDIGIRARAREFEASISGMNFNDLNSNGIRDRGEPGLAGWQIVLKNSTNLTIARTTTDEDGNYTFYSLSKGVYTLSVILKDGWRQTCPAEGEYTIVINESENNVTGINFGNRELPHEPVPLLTPLSIIVLIGAGMVTGVRGIKRYKTL